MLDFIKNLDFAIFNLPSLEPNNYHYIRDICDLPILANAIEADVDIIISGDKDFDDVKMVKPIILKPRQYIETFMN